MRNLIFLSGLMAGFSLNLWAANTPANFDQGKFDSLIATTVATGVAMDVTKDSSFRSLSNVVPADKDVAHQAEYFSTIGANDELGVYHPMEISIVSENWQIDDKGNWLIEQWIVELNLKGQVVDVLHGTLSEAKNGDVLGTTTFPTEATDPQVLALVGQKLDFWYAINASH